MPSEIFMEVANNYEYPFILFNEDGIHFLNPRAKELINNDNNESVLKCLLRHKNNTNFIMREFDDKSKKYIASTNSVRFKDKVYYFCTIKDDKRTYRDLMFSRILDKSSVSIILFDSNMKILYVNKSGQDLYGYREEELIGRPIYILSGEKDKEDLFQNFIRQANKNMVWRGEDIRKKKDGEIFPSSTSIAKITDEDGEFICYYEASRDNTFRYKRSKKLEIESKTDELTGLANRRSLFWELERQWRYSRKHKTGFSIIFGDIDNFKEYNDTYGHLAGDAVLRAVAQSMKKTLRSMDFIARYGGEEFVIILTEVTQYNAEQIAEKLLQNIRKLNIEHKTSPIAPYITMSFGIYSKIIDYRDKNQSAVDCIHNADRALYKAKNNGKNRYEIYKPEDKDTSIMHNT